MDYVSKKVALVTKTVCFDSPLCAIVEAERSQKEELEELDEVVLIGSNKK